jgi:hypothetical protein
VAIGAWKVGGWKRWNVAGSDGICGYRFIKSEAKLTENRQEISQYASSQVYQNKSRFDKAV